MFLTTATLAASDSPKPLATLKIRDTFPFANRATVAFLSDENIAVAGYPGSDTSSFIATIATFRRTGDSLRSSAIGNPHLKVPTLGRGIFAAANGSLLLYDRRAAQLWSADLKSAVELTLKNPFPAVPQSNVVAEFQLRGWSLYRIAPDVSLIRGGDGQILSVSDDFVAFRTEHDLVIEQVNGKVTGHFQIAAEASCFTQAVILGRDKLFLYSCGDYRIVDFSGKILGKVAALDGWGARYGTSRDGRRLLFDHFTRRTSTIQRLQEFVESIISFGMGPIVTAKGEDIRVVDTLSGGVCFHLDSPESLFGISGEYHADLSPSGRFVAVVENKLKDISLSLYELPETCSGN